MALRVADHSDGGWDEVFRAMADGHRRRIVAVLCSGPRRAGELARAVGLAPNAVSFHLRWLKTAGLVVVRRDGRSLWYSVVGSVLKGWLAAVRGQFGDVADSSRVIASTATHREREATGQPGQKTPGPARGTSGQVGATSRPALADRPHRPIGSPKPRATRKPPSGPSEDIATDTLPDELL